MMKKAFLAVCLFLLIIVEGAARDLIFTSLQLTAYEDVLNLRLEKAQFSLRNDDTSQGRYIHSLSEIFELLLTEDKEKFSEYESRFHKRIDEGNESAIDLFVQAEMHLQWCFVYLKFGHEFDAALHLRKSYLLTKEVRKKHPSFQSILKTAGLLNVLIGSVPDKYNWILDVLNMEGDVEEGIGQLESQINRHHPLAAEASLLRCFILGYILQQPEESIQALYDASDIHRSDVALFLAANLYLKASRGDECLKVLSELEGNGLKNRLPYISYLRGEALLYKGQYNQSIQAFEHFLNMYKGQNCVKDAHFKIGVCHLLSSDEALARKSFDIAKSAGKEFTEADKYAARALAETRLPSVPLTKARYYTDGGYYSDALKILESVTPQSFNELKDKIELPYRKARLYHKMSDPGKAVDLYHETIKLSEGQEYYFAPNACLQLGYIYMADHKDELARSYFNKALSYKKHEYKNSIDSKARSALSHLNDRK